MEERRGVVTDGGIKGKGDELVGVKENVMMGKLVGGGRGMMN